MDKMRFEKKVMASAEKVYKTMLGLDDIKNYEHWTAAFNPTSTYEGKWEKGAKMYFVGTDETGKRGGMVAEIAELVPNKFVSIRHYGILDGNREITTGPDVEKWAGGLENYSFEEKNGVTMVRVETGVTEEMREYFDNIWPQALDKLKELVEQ